MKEKSLCLSPGQAGCMQRKLVKCSSKTLKGNIMWYPAQLTPEGSLILMELLVLMEEQRKPEPG